MPHIWRSEDLFFCMRSSCSRTQSFCFTSLWKFSATSFKSNCAHWSHSRADKAELYLLWPWWKSSLQMNNFMGVTESKAVLSADILGMFIWGQKFSHLKKINQSTVLQELCLLNWGLGEDGSELSWQEPREKLSTQGQQRRALGLRPTPVLLLCWAKMPVSKDNEKQSGSKRDLSAAVFQPGNKQLPLITSPIPYRHNSSWWSWYMCYLCFHVPFKETTRAWTLDERSPVWGKKIQGKKVSERLF